MNNTATKVILLWFGVGLYNDAFSTQ